jgi:hypothetical protein
MPREKFTNGEPILNKNAEGMMQKEMSVKLDSGKLAKTGLREEASLTGRGIRDREMDQIEDIIDSLIDDYQSPLRVVLTKGSANRYYGTLVVAKSSA